MPKGKSEHDDDFKKMIIKLIESGQSITKVAREYDLNSKNIYNWKKKFGSIELADGSVSSNDELLKLRKKNKELQDEVDILKKAMVIFTKK